MKEPGANFSRALSIGYSFNKAIGVLSCKLYKVTSMVGLVLSGNYAERELAVIRKTDEEHNETD